MMTQSTLSKWLKIAIAMMGLCILVVYGWLVPNYGQGLVAANPEMAYCYWPWLVLITMTAIPICVALVLGWKVADGIGKNQSFTRKNAKHLKSIALLAMIDVGVFFVGNILFMFLNMNHPAVLLLAMLVCLVGIAIAVAAAVLSRLISKAAQLQVESDLTI